MQHLSRFSTLHTLAADVAGREGIDDIPTLTTCMQDLLRFEFFGDQFSDLLPSEKEQLRRKALKRFFDKQSRSMAKYQQQATAV